MAVIFSKATRFKKRLRLALCGPSGSGKTYTALALGTRIGARVAVVDTEHESAALYADLFDFDTCILDNYHPDNYVNAINEAEAAGYDLVILDSLSHAWQGKGGILDMVDKYAEMSRSGSTFPAWAKVNPIQHNLVESILSSPMHMIVTMRTKTAYSVDTVNGKSKPVKIGTTPIQKGELEYEFTIIADLDHNHNFSISKTRSPELDGYICNKAGAEVAEKISAWLSDGKDVEYATKEQVAALYKWSEGAKIETHRVKDRLEAYGATTFERLTKENAAIILDKISANGKGE